MSHVTDAGQRDQVEVALIRLDEAWSQLARRIAVDLKDHPCAVPQGQSYLLRLLDRRGPLCMSDLARYMDITQAGAATLVDRAVEAGLVERQRDLADRRVVRVVLSEAGERTLAQIRQARARILARYLNQLDPKEVQWLAMLLDRVSDVMLAEQDGDRPAVAAG